MRQRTRHGEPKALRPRPTPNSAREFLTFLLPTTTLEGQCLCDVRRSLFYLPPTVSKPRTDINTGYIETPLPSATKRTNISKKGHG